MIITSSAGRVAAYSACFLGLVAFCIAGWLKKLPLAVVFTAGAVAAVIGGIVIPGIAAERIVVSSEKIERSHGFWFERDVWTVPLSNLESISEEWIQVPQRGTGRADPRWVFRYRDGNLDYLPLSDLLFSEREAVVAFFKKTGIPFRD